MSASLHWRPVIRKPDWPLSDQLMFAMRKRWERSGQDTPSMWAGAPLRPDDIPYLQALADAGVKDAEVLMAAIRQYGEVEVYEQR